MIAPTARRTSPIPAALAIAAGLGGVHVPTPARGQAPDVSILGIRLGVPMAEAESHLAGYQLRQYPGRAAVTVANKARTEQVLVEALDGRVAYVSRVIFLRSPEDVVSRSTYQRQLEQKFGPQSSMSTQYLSDQEVRQRAATGTVFWQFDGSGRLIHEQPPCAATEAHNAPGAVSPGPAFPGRNGSQLITVATSHWWIPAGRPAFRDYASNPACFVRVSGVLEASTNTTPTGAIDTITLEMLDQQPFAALGAQRGAQAELQQRDRQRQLDQRTGPPPR